MSRIDYTIVAGISNRGYFNHLFYIINTIPIVWLELIPRSSENINLLYSVEMF